MKIKLIGIFILFSLSFCSEISFKLNFLDSSVTDITWCGDQRTETLLVITEFGSLYRSEDKGFTWTSLSHDLHDLGKTELEKNEHEVGTVSRLLTSPVDKYVLIILGTHGINWISRDCGKNLKALNHGRKIQEYVFHPTEKEWGLASAFTLCEDFKNGEPCHYFKELFVTKNLGETWDLLSSYVVQFSWGVKTQNHIDQGIPKERILVTYEPKGKGNQKIEGWNYKIDFIVSDNFLKTSKTLMFKGNKFVLTDNFLYVAQLIDQDTQETKLFVSKSTTPEYEFKEVELGHNLKEHSYSFLDFSDNSVFVHVNHFGEKSPYGYVYTSDENGNKFSLSLEHNTRSNDGECEFEKLKSINGIYIANSIDKKAVDDHNMELSHELNEEEESMEAKHHDKVKKTASTDLHSFIQTMISFNKGGKWEFLSPPLRDSQNKQYDCEDQCYLHLHGVSSPISPLHSSDNAVGILIGNGNVGKFLSHDEEDISTFLSRDGGLTWNEIKKGPHHFEIGDHGGIIVLAEDMKASDTLLYSWDEGVTWQDFRFSEEKMVVKEVLTEQTSTSLNFIIYGNTQTKKGKKQGAVISVDFTSLNKPECKNANNPNSADSDYETWSPSDSKNNKNSCILGSKYVYVRRKRESSCFNPINLERKSTLHICECTEEDFECDVGFERKSIGEPCTAIHTISDEERNKPPENCQGYYNISRGYRRVPGNVCKGGVQNDPIIVPCSNSLFTVFSYLLALSVFVGGVFLYCQYKESLHGNFSQLQGNVSNFVKNIAENKAESVIAAKKKGYSNPSDTIEFPEDDNILFEDNENVKEKVHEDANEMEDIKNELLGVKI